MVHDCIVLSFDIECAGRTGSFPQPEIDPVIQIASMVTRQSEPESLFKKLFTPKDTANIVGAGILTFSSERMLEYWI